MLIKNLRSEQSFLQPMDESLYKHIKLLFYLHLLLMDVTIDLFHAVERKPLLQRTQQMKVYNMNFTTRMVYWQ